MTDNRPHIELETYWQNEVLVKRTIKVLKSKYNTFAKRKQGLFELADVEKTVFGRVMFELSPKTELERHIIESLFDQFLGGLEIAGNSEDSFKMMELGSLRNELFKGL